MARRTQHNRETKKEGDGWTGTGGAGRTTKALDIHILRMWVELIG
jgi:hypothetical protein